MKKYIIYLINVFLLISLTGCPESFPEDDGAILLINNSDEDIVWFFISHGGTKDTSQLSDSYPWSEIEDYKIAKKTIYSYSIYTVSIKEVLDERFLQFYFLNYDTVLTVPWERIRDENIILKKVYFETWEDLEECDFTITYP
jgi:hypothetical protein